MKYIIFCEKCGCNEADKHVEMIQVHVQKSGLSSNGTYTYKQVTYSPSKSIKISYCKKCYSSYHTKFLLLIIFTTFSALILFILGYKTFDRMVGGPDILVIFYFLSSAVMAMLASMFYKDAEIESFCKKIISKKSEYKYDHQLGYQWFSEQEWKSMK